jgi:hypothetical protein
MTTFRMAADIVGLLSGGHWRISHEATCRGIAAVAAKDPAGVRRALDDGAVATAVVAEAAKLGDKRMAITALNWRRWTPLPPGTDPDVPEEALCESAQDGPLSYGSVLAWRHRHDELGAWFCEVGCELGQHTWSDAARYGISHRERRICDRVLALAPAGALSPRVAADCRMIAEQADP